MRQSQRNGSSYAVKKAYNDIIACTNNYTKDAWIYKFDLQGFFMSIDKRLLWADLKPVLEAEYNEWDKEWFMYVIEKRIFNRPQKNCIKVCSDDEWLPLPNNKSLFWQDEWHGLPIGDLLSQMLVGFFLIKFIDYLKSLGFEYISNYVDDFVIISPTKEKILENIPDMRNFLTTMGITLHPRKCYIQHYTKGLSFLGAIIKPHRIYAGRRLRDNASSILIPHSPKAGVSSINSYLGLLKPYNSRKLRKYIADKAFARYHDKVCFGKDYLKMIIYKRPKKKHSIKGRGLKVIYLKDL